MTKFLTTCRIACLFGLFVKSASANIVGIGAQNFNTTPSGIDFVTVHSSETLDPGIVNFGFFLNYAVNTLPYFDNTQTGRLNFKDGLLSSDLNFGVGLWPGIEAGLSFPAVLSQNETDNTSRGEFVSSGLTEIRALSKFRFWGNDKKGAAIIFSVNFNLVNNDPLAGQDNGPTTNIELAVDNSWGNWNAGLNLGYRKRNPGIAIAGSPLEPLGDQWLASMAASYYLKSIDSKIISEMFFGFPVKQTGNDLSDRNNSAGELTLGIKHDMTHNLAIHGGMGTELVHAQASPDWRIYSGLNYVFGPVFKKPFSFNFGSSTFVLNDIQFEFDSDEMTKESQKSLEFLIAELQKPGGFKTLSITGHTDSVGRDDYNKSLSLRRAEAIKKYLVGVHGFDSKKISSQGMGEEEPIAENSNYQGRQKNRRVEFTVKR
jgi:outer membrane protein OmpA-like peptidoglycan-associated protein